MGCITSAKYSMKADVYEKIVEQNLDSGQTQGTWVKVKTISCYANSIKTDAVSDASSGKKFINDYDEYTFIRMETKAKLGKRHRISNIRDKNNRLVWTEDSWIENIPTQFEVQGNLPTIDFFGTVSEYSYLLKRTEVQDDL